MCHTRGRLHDLNDETRLSLPERQLANELAYWVAAKMWHDLGEYITDGEVYDIGQSEYEGGCDVLKLVGVYQQGKHNNLYKVVVPLDSVQRHMASLAIISRETLNKLLYSFIKNYVSYDGALSGGRQSFTVHQNLSKVANLLVTNGFAEKHQDGFEWSEKIDPIINRLHMWDEDGELWAEEISREETSASMAETLPWLVRRKVDAALKTRNYDAAMNILSNHWDGEQWLRFRFISKAKPGVDNRIDLRVLRLLVRKLE